MFKQCFCLLHVYSCVADFYLLHCKFKTRASSISFPVSPKSPLVGQWVHSFGVQLPTHSSLEHLELRKREYIHICVVLSLGKDPQKIPITKASPLRRILPYTVSSQQTLENAIFKENGVLPVYCTPSLP